MTPDALRALISQSGMSASAFARDVLSRDERTVRRWLSGEVEIPRSAAEWLARVESVAVEDGAVVVSVRRE